MNPNILSLLGLAKRGGMLVAGEEPVDAMVRAKDARLLLTASDAAENTARRVRHFAETGACLLLQLPFTKEELGHAVGITSCAVVALTDIGFAASIVRRMAVEDPSYSECAEKLEIKAQRAAERKAEREVYEKRCKQAAPKRTVGSAQEAKPEQSARPDAPKKFANPGRGAKPDQPPRRGASRQFGGPCPGARPGRQSGPAPKKFDSPTPGTKPERSPKPGTKKFAGPSPGTKPAWPSRPAPKKRFGRPAPEASPERADGRTAPGPYTPKAPSSRKPAGQKGSARTSHRPFQAERRGGTPARPYAHSHPVKKGKGSFRKKDGS